MQRFLGRVVCLTLVAVCAAAVPSYAAAQRPSREKAVVSSLRDTGARAKPKRAHRTRSSGDVHRPLPIPVNPTIYYVDFRARTAASYGHAFVWYGRLDQREVEVAGLHPKSDSVIPYLLGHLVPVPGETGASYGDLDEEYLTARFRVILNEEQAKKVFAYIKQRQTTSALWHAPTMNCVSFVSGIASYMGLKTPTLSIAMPEQWINDLRELNGGSDNLRLKQSMPAS